MNLGRWAYCKQCYKNVLPEIGDDIVVCNECGYGLAPIEDVIKAGSYKAWREKIEKAFHDKYCKDLT